MKGNNRMVQADSILTQAITTVLGCLGVSLNNIMLVDILYSDGGSTLDAKVEQFNIIRADQGERSPVLFYGFERLEKLGSEPRAAILKSPAIGYIQLPASVGDLVNVVKRISKEEMVGEPLDAETGQRLALEWINGVRHDLKNVVMLLNQQIAGLKSDSRGRKKAEWRLLSEFGSDFIEKRAKRYDKVKGIIEDSCRGNKSIRSIPKTLKKTNRLYLEIKNLVDGNDLNEANVSAVIKKGDEVIRLIKMVEQILEKV